MKHVILILIVIVLLTGGYAVAGETQKCAASAQECLNGMAKHMKNTGIVGLDGDWDDSTGGLRVTKFFEGTNAKDAGVRAGDVLVKINGIALSDKEATKADTANRKPGQEVAIVVLREGAEQTMKVTLISMPEEMAAEKIGHPMLKDLIEAEAAET